MAAGDVTIGSSKSFAIYQNDGNSTLVQFGGGFAITSSTGALIVPRMTTAERNAIPSPVNGSLIYNETTAVFEGYEGGAWVNL